MAVTRGEVWRADLSPAHGTEQAGVRPVLVIQTDRANPHSPHTIIVPFTTRIRQKLLPSHVLVPAGEGGLTQDSVALCEQIRVVAPRSPFKSARQPSLIPNAGSERCFASHPGVMIRHGSVCAGNKNVHGPSPSHRRGLRFIVSRSRGGLNSGAR